MSEILYDLMIAVICLASAFLGCLAGSALSYRKGWHAGLQFRNGCDQEQQNMASQKDHTINELKKRVSHLSQIIDRIQLDLDGVGQDWRIE